jgi:hypothetical protein
MVTETMQKDAQDLIGGDWIDYLGVWTMITEVQNAGIDVVQLRSEDGFNWRAPCWESYTLRGPAKPIQFTPHQLARLACAVKWAEDSGIPKKEADVFYKLFEDSRADSAVV